MPINKELLEIMGCPKCKGNIRLDELKKSIICDKCRLLYHIKNGIPIMLINKAERLEDNFYGEEK